jgi:ArsR family transcriptional regulator, arsenate/arsenite/antimonite-responsive transcriptional repressor
MDEIDLFKALGDGTRLKILESIREKEKCICEIIPKTGKSQPNVSQHLKVLKTAGLIKERKDGTRVMIRISNEKIYELIDLGKKI